jgi:hypothetical protein
MQGDVEFKFYRGFRFESHWISWPGFYETVQEIWGKPVNTQDAILRIHVKPIRRAKALKLWRQKKFADWKIRWAILNITLANLEKAQEVWPLTQDELDFKHYLKTKSLGLAAMQKARARQHSRLTWIQKGVTNTRFFQLHTNARRKKTFISSLSGQTWTVVSQEEKSNLIHTLLPGHGETNARTKAINWQ